MIGQTAGRAGLRRPRRCRRSRTTDGHTPASHARSRSSATSSGWPCRPSWRSLLIWLIITGTSNAVNLTDGLDGLATGASRDGLRRLHAGQHLAEQPVAAQTHRRAHLLRGPRPARPRRRSRPRSPAPASASCGGTPRPAAIFMGDTGSLALGGALAGLRDPDPHRAAAARSSAACSSLDHAVGDASRSAVFKASASGFPAVFRVKPAPGLPDGAAAPPLRACSAGSEVTVVIRFWIITGLCVATGLGIFYAEWVVGALTAGRGDRPRRRCATMSRLRTQSRESWQEGARTR